MDLNKDTLNLIKSFEGWRSKAYKDAVGVWTIGYGHTSMAGEPKVKAGMVISEAEGEAILARDLQKYAKAVQDAVKVPLNANQFGALTSWCYNVGPGNVRKSTLVKKLNRGDYASVPSEMAKWNKAGGRVLRGLVRRREAEGKLFQKPVQPPKPIPAPSPSLKPSAKPVELSGGFWAFLVGVIGKLFRR